MKWAAKTVLRNNMLRVNCLHVKGLTCFLMKVPLGSWILLLPTVQLFLEWIKSLFLPMVLSPDTDW